MERCRLVSYTRRISQGSELSFKLSLDQDRVPRTVSAQVASRAAWMRVCVCVCVWLRGRDPTAVPLRVAV